MSKCSVKCNEIKKKIDSISGLDDDFIYLLLQDLDGIVTAMTKMVYDYVDEDPTNGTVFKK